MLCAVDVNIVRKTCNIMKILFFHKNCLCVTRRNTLQQTTALRENGGHAGADGRVGQWARAKALGSFCAKRLSMLVFAVGL